MGMVMVIRYRAKSRPQSYVFQVIIRDPNVDCMVSKLQKNPDNEAQ